MSVLQLSDAYRRARTLLNDDDASNWPDYRLLLKTQQAFEELEAELILAGIPIINSQTIIITVPPYNIDAFGGTPLDISTLAGYPTDIILPIWMKERQIGEIFRDFVDMTEVDTIPTATTETNLRYWCWYQNTIIVLGALNPVQVQLRYQRILPIPNANTDSIIVPLGQMYLSYKIAALCCDSVGDKDRRDDYSKRADINLDRIIRMNIRQQQDLPAKRRPYHRGQGRNRVLRDF